MLRRQWRVQCWDWRGIGVFLFLLCQADHRLTQWSVPLLALAGALAVWRGAFAAEPPPNAAEWAGLGFLAVVLITSFTGVDSQRSLHLNSALVPALLMYVLARNTCAKPMLWGLALLMLVYGLRVAWAAGHAPAAEPAQWVHAASAPWLVVPNDWCWTVITLPWLWWRGAGLPRWVAGGFTVLVLSGAVWLQSRSAVLCAVAAAAAASLILIRRRSWLKPVPLAAMGGGLALAGLLFVIVDSSTDFAVSAKFARVLDTRLALWWAAWQVFWQAPWTGVGPHNFVQVYQAYLPQPGGILPVDTRLTPWPHQLPLEILAEMGLLGAAAAALWCHTLMRHYIRLQHHAVITVPLTAAVAAFVFAAMVESSLLRIWTWIMLAVILAKLVQAPLQQIPPTSVQSC